MTSELYVPVIQAVKQVPNVQPVYLVDTPTCSIEKLSVDRRKFKML